jgi:hypothetical protein
MKWKTFRILTNQTFDLLQAQHWLDNRQNWNRFPNQKRQPIRVCVQTNSNDNMASLNLMK